MNKQPTAQATLFIPPGQIHLRGAVPIAAEKWRPEQFAALKLKPEEEQNLGTTTRQSRIGNAISRLLLIRLGRT
jgi:hypothetical protein